MSAFLDKVSDFFFKNDDDNLPGENPQFEEPGAADKGGNKTKADYKPPKKGNLISVPTKNKNGENLEIVLFRASSYEDMQEIARHIKERKVAVVNFEDMDKDVAQRMVDFLSGAAFALDGIPRKVSGGTFIFSCSQVDMSGQIMDRDGSFEAENLTEDSRFSSNRWLRS